jgi:hypothetical protein
VIVVFAASIVGSVAVGWLAGMLTFRRSLTWCSACGQALSCLNCLREAQLIGKP